MDRKKAEQVNMSSPVIYNDTTHTYTFNGESVPSVTDILELLDHHLYGDRNSATFMEMRASREFGSSIHNLIQDFHDGQPASGSDLELRYLEQYKAFLKDTGYVPKGIEVPMYCHKYGYAGKPDSWGIYRRRHAIIEVKTGAQVPRTATMQTNAYEKLLLENLGYASIPCYTLLLHHSGYRLRRVTENEWGVFVSLLNQWRWLNNK